MIHLPPAISYHISAGMARKINDFPLAKSAVFLYNTPRTQDGEDGAK